MSSGQLDLSEYGVELSEQTPSASAGDSDSEGLPKLGFDERPDPLGLSPEIAAARNVDWVVCTGRYPYTFDAVRLGFGIGHREDSSYQWVPGEVSLPVHFLDNDYKDSDLDRFVERVFELKPEIAVLGDIYDPSDLPAHLDAAERIWDEYPDMELILVPKCEAVLEEIPETFVLGYPNGTSDIQATDIASHRDWRRLPNRLHILGGTPLETLEEIRALTTNWVTGEEPADIAGLDWNGFQRYMDWGDYVDATGGWHGNLREEYIPKRDMMRYSLLNCKHFWISHGVWPNASLEDLQVREELLAANYREQTDAPQGSDAFELLISPPPETDRNSQPIYRTDTSRAEVLEPLSPLAGLFSRRRLSWAPDGVLAQSLTYRSPQSHLTELTCPGCGAHVFAEPTATAGGRDVQDGHSPTLSADIVSYGKQLQETANHYNSVPTEGPEKLTSHSIYPTIHVYCCTSCRRRAEGQSPRLLFGLDEHEQFPSPGYPDGHILGRVDIPLSPP